MCSRTRNRTGRRTAVRNQQSCGLLVSPREIPVGSAGEALLLDAVWADVRKSKSSSGRLTSRPVPTVQWTVGKSAGDSRRVTVYSPSFGWGILFYPRHRTFPPGGLQAAPTSNPETSTPAQRHGGAKAPALRVPGHLRPFAGWGLDSTAGNCRLLWVCRGGVYAARQHPGRPTVPRAACRPPLHPTRKPATPAQHHGGAKAPALRVTGNLRPLVGWGLDPTAGKRRFFGNFRQFFLKIILHSCCTVL